MFLCHIHRIGLYLENNIVYPNFKGEDIFMNQFEFRSVKPDEFDQVVQIEHISFPPNEACAPKVMQDRISYAADLFLVAVDKLTGKAVGFLTGVATDEDKFRDEFFTDISQHNPQGCNVMLLSLAVHPDYRMKGLAREIVNQYCLRESQKGRKALYLTCLEDKVDMYKKFGFVDKGTANSNWGGEQWHEMITVLLA